MQELRASLLHDVGDHDASIAAATELMRDDNVYSFHGTTWTSFGTTTPVFLSPVPIPPALCGVLYLVAMRMEC